MNTFVEALLCDLSKPPTLAFPDKDAVVDESRPSRLWLDARIGSFSASLEQEQDDGSSHPIVYISRATIPAERDGIALDLEAGSIVWAI